ncbi:MAG: hypothetical protein P9L94_18595 [Candidatus Hinthialibacter antarcticus]|nr:hypothetical protein [Candidatus Hinthialibacter antarcticus]
MKTHLSLIIVSIYSVEYLKEILHLDDVDDWILESLAPDDSLPLNRPSGIQLARADAERAISWRIHVGPFDEKESIDAVRQWMNQLVNQFGRLPILFYMLLGSTEETINTVDVDELSESTSGPLLLIEKRLWRLSQMYQMAFPKESEWFPEKRGLFFINREPEKIWIERLESNIHELHSRWTRHPLDYAPMDDSLLHPEIREERQRMDNVINIPTTSQKTFEPEKVVIHLMKGERADTISLRAYQDTPIGKRLGGRSLLASCNKDINLISGWRDNNTSFEVHNAASMNFEAAAPQGSLPEAMMTGRVRLKNAWIEGENKSPTLPTEPIRARQRMVWPNSNR